MREGLKGERLSEKERRNLDILNTIRRATEISRADISRLTGLNIVTVSNYINIYVRRGLVQEGGLDVSTGGRRPELVRLNPDYGYTVGIDLGAPHILEDTAIIGTVMNVSSRQIITERVKKEKESVDRFTEKIINLIASLIKNSGISRDKFLGIGMGIWGVLDRYKGTVRYTPESGNVLSYLELQDNIERKFNLPTMVEHDAMVAALGEKWAGIGLEHGVENILFVCSDSSTGIIIRDELYYGASKSAGELNLNPPDSASEEEMKKYCWVSYEHGCCLRSRGIDLGIAAAAKAAVADKKSQPSVILEMAKNDPDLITLNVVVKAAQARDKVAIAILEDAGAYLGAKIAYLINLFNPEAVVIGRGVEKAGNIFFDALRRSVSRWAFEESAKVARVIPSSLGDDSVAVGAGTMVTQRVFSRIG
ncbi:MAG: ROK family protein [Candidatus Omnitrophica bacterium]|nr:ROK family protein [Candidatus Omnitrophota bacterium]